MDVKNFDGKFNYKGALLEFAAKNKCTANFKTSNVWNVHGYPEFRTSVIYADRGFTGDSGTTKIEAEQKAAFAALQTLQCAPAQNQTLLFQKDQNSGPGEEAKFSLYSSDLLRSPRQDEGDISEKSFEGVYNPWKVSEEEPDDESSLSDRKAAKYRSYIDEYNKFFDFKESRKFDTFQQALRTYSTIVPLMVNGKVAKHVKAMIFWFLFQGPKEALQISKEIFGQAGTTAMINPLLYRIKWLKKVKGSARIWEIVL